MARWILITLMLLLPLRGWAGAFMPLHMAAHGGVSAIHSAPAAHPGHGEPVAHDVAHPSAPCPMHAGMGHGGDGLLAHGDEPVGAGGCDHCQLCQANASLPVGVHWVLLPLALSHAATAAATLRGLNLSPDHPPPIALALI